MYGIIEQRFSVILKHDTRVNINMKFSFYRSYLNFMTEELQNPFVNLPRAIYVSLPLVTGIYLLANLSYLAVLGPVGVLATEAIAVVSIIKYY